jgi:hypothetical protein
MAIVVVEVGLVAVFETWRVDGFGEGGGFQKYAAACLEVRI